MIESWKQSALVAILVIGAAVVGAGLQVWSLGHGPGIQASASKTSVVGGCPGDREICDFAVQAQEAVQRGDPTAIISPSSTWFADGSSIGAAMLSQLEGGAPPRVVGIVCANISGKAPCSEFFALVFDSLPAGQERPAPPRGYMAVLGFQRASPMPVLTYLSANQAALIPGSGLCVYGQLLGGGCTDGLHVTAVAFDSSKYAASPR